jgi:hypothetical protein
MPTINFGKEKEVKLPARAKVLMGNNLLIKTVLPFTKTKVSLFNRKMLFLIAFTTKP